MKKVIIAMVLCLLSCSACTSVPKDPASSSKTPRISFELEYPEASLDEVIENTSCIFYGRCTEITDSTEYLGYRARFRVLENLKGQYDSKVPDFYTLAGTDVLKKGKDCLIFCGRQDSAFYDKSSYGVSFVMTETENGVYTGRPFTDLTGTTLKEITEQIRAYMESHPWDGNTVVSGEYCHSNSLQEIIDYSPYVLLVKVLESGEVAERTQGPVIFKIEERLKGDPGEANMITCHPGEMNVGESYILLVRKPGETSLTFQYTSPKSVLKADSKEGQEVLRLLGR